ncbi:hypothetical protein MMC14_002345 [Varicellaria rhodocarpa]|nr:hypothetical protein [Varicellaria rhodocarpa]
MPGRLPINADFLSSLQMTIIPPPNSQKPENVLLLLHGLGDTELAFTKLARQLHLPETVCIIIQGPTPLPFELGGFHWGDDIIFDQTTGEMEIDTGFLQAVRFVGEDILQKTLLERCGYKSREIILFGFGQGGMAALAIARHSTDELGGVISIGGPLARLPKGASTTSRTIRTPVIVLGGSSGTLIATEAITDMQKVFEFVQHTKWKKRGDGMPQSREEMMSIMQFFSRRLKSRTGVPEGSIEIG